MGHGCGRTQDGGGAGSHQRWLPRCDKRGLSIPQIIGSIPQGIAGTEKRESDTARTYSLARVGGLRGQGLTLRGRGKLSGARYGER